MTWYHSPCPSTYSRYNKDGKFRRGTYIFLDDRALMRIFEQRYPEAYRKEMINSTGDGYIKADRLLAEEFRIIDYDTNLVVFETEEDATFFSLVFCEEISEIY